jgi:hypothetical protein
MHKKILNEFLHRLTFERQLGIMVTLGIVLLALSSSLVGSWQSKEHGSSKRAGAALRFAR